MSVSALTQVSSDSEDEAAIRATAREIAQRCRVLDDGSDHARCWKALRSAGFTELRSTEGDSEPLASTRQVIVVVEEMARAVCGAPLVGTLVAAEALRLLAGPTLPEGVETEAVTVALRDDLTTFGVGDKALAFDAAPEVTNALTFDGTRVGLVPLGQRRPTQDLSRGAATLRDPAAGSTLGAFASPAQLAELEDFARVVIAADLLGAAGGVLAEAVEYAGQRAQFGRPIGSFQAVQHLLAKAYARLEALRSAVLYASWATDTEHDRHEAALVAKAFGGDAAVDIVQTCVQVFGGVAITWEFRAHRHLRRVLLGRAVLGSGSMLAGQLLDHVTDANRGGGS